jgi:hypothetical protein
MRAFPTGTLGTRPVLLASAMLLCASRTTATPPDKPATDSRPPLVEYQPPLLLGRYDLFDRSSEARHRDELNENLK